MHISDGVLSTPVWAGGLVISAAIIAVTTRKVAPEDIPKTAVMTSAFFVTSLIHVPIGPTSIHLILNGLTGMILGSLSFVSIFLALILQALLFQHGGITTVGVNAIVMGLPALLSYKLFDMYKRFGFKASAGVFGAMAGGLAILLSALILALFLVLAGEEFIGVAKLAVLSHIPVLIIEAAITGFAASFIIKVKPGLLERRRR